MTKDMYELRNEDIIDVRDIDERIDELADLEVFAAEDDTLTFSDEDAQELDALRTFREELGTDVSDIIRDSYFEDYARELAEDIGAIGSDNQWPLYCIDWDWAARELQMDYSAVEFDGITFWVMG